MTQQEQAVNEPSKSIWSRETFSLSDPASVFLQRELGLTQRQIINKAKRLGLRTRKVYGRLWIATEDIQKLREPVQPQHNEPGWQLKEYEGYDYLGDDYPTKNESA
jgi:hypothetical protein